MPTNLSIRVLGIPQAKEMLERNSGRELAKRTFLGMREGGKLLVGPIRAQAPKRTGTLARSVSVRSDRRTGGVSVGPRAWYRHFVIRGTSRGVSPNPFVDRGVAGAIGQVESRVADVILRGRR